MVAVEYDFCSPTDFKIFLIPKKVAFLPQNASGRGARSPRSREPRRTRRILPQPSTVDPALERRKHVYRNDLYSLHVGANPISQYCNFTPHTFAGSLELQSRARKWLRRELGVFDFLNPDHGDSGPVQRRANNAEFLLEYIVAILKSLDIKGSSGRAADLLQEFLGRENARLFLHELEAWLRSPYNDLKDWDSAVQYPEAIEEPDARNAMGRRKGDKVDGTRGPTIHYGEQRSRTDTYRPYNGG